MRYRLRTLLIAVTLLPPIIAWLGPRFYEDTLDGIWVLTGPHHESFTIQGDGSSVQGNKLTSNGKSYGRVKPGERVALKSRGRIYVNGKPREPEDDP